MQVQVLEEYILILRGGFCSASVYVYSKGKKHLNT